MKVSDLHSGKYVICTQFFLLYEGVSKSFETSSIDRQPMAVRE